MRYPVAIEPGDADIAFGVVVPDLPGCFSAGDTLDEAIIAAEEAALAWIDAALDSGAHIPAPSTLTAIRAMADYAGWAFGVVNIDPAALDSRSERVNIILPRRVLLRLDAMAKANGETRSGFIAHLTLAGPTEAA